MSFDVAPAAKPTAREDLLALAGAALLVPGLWLLLGWRPDRLVSGYDAISALLPMVQALVDAHGNPGALAYRPELLGGVALRDTLGPQPLLVVLAAAGLDAPTILNLATFWVQTLFAFFAQRGMRDLAVLLGTAPWTIAARVLVAVVFVAFAPFVGWRVGHGHLTLLVGLLPFLAMLALLAAATVRSTTRVLAVTGILTIAASLPFIGQQMVLYGAVFGLPILVGLWWSGGRSRRALLPPASVGLAGLLLAGPAYAPMVAHALGPDALRELGGAVNTYTYLTAGVGDWLTSLPWGFFPLPGRPEVQHHESNVPVGPLVLLLALVPQRGRAIVAGLAVSATLGVLFASNVRPVSDLLLGLVPPLRSFRVPTRALLPVVLVLPLVTLAVFGDSRASERVRTGRPGSRRQLAILLLVCISFAALFISGASIRELVSWGLVALLLLRRHSFLARPAVWAAVGAALAGASLGAFQERLLPFPDAAGLLAQARLLGERAREAEPALAAPLTRLALDTERGPLGANAAFAAGLASLDGYAFPQRRFVALVRALRGESYSQNALLLRFHEELPASRALFQLYNVAFRLEEGPRGGAPVVSRRGPTAGPAWFPAALVEDGSLGDLAGALSSWGDDAHERAHQELHLLPDDRSASGLHAPLPEGCAAAEVGGLTEPSGGGERAVRSRNGDMKLSIEVRTNALCPLVLALNYGGILEAHGLGADGRWRPLATFAAYGALLGIVVEPEVTLAEVSTRPWPPAWTIVAAALGALVAGVVVFRSGR
jgi:hypothetical protein